MVDRVFIPGTAEGGFGIQLLIPRQHIGEDANITDAVSIILFGDGIQATARIAGLADEEEEVGHGHGVFFALGLGQQIIPKDNGRGLGMSQKSGCFPDISH